MSVTFSENVWIYLPLWQSCEYVSVLRQLKSKYNMTVTFTLYYYPTSQHENVKSHAISS